MAPLPPPSLLIFFLAGLGPSWTWPTNFLVLVQAADMALSLLGRKSALALCLFIPISTTQSITLPTLTVIPALLDRSPHQTCSTLEQITLCPRHVTTHWTYRPRLLPNLRPPSIRPVALHHVAPPPDPPSPTPLGIPLSISPAPCPTQF